MKKKQFTARDVKDLVSFLVMTATVAVLFGLAASRISKSFVEDHPEFRKLVEDRNNECTNICPIRAP